MKNFRSWIPGLCLGIFSILTIVFTQVKMSRDEHKVKNLIAPPAHLEHFSFGFQEVIADMLWVRALQDFDYCEEKATGINCIDNSWLYRMIDTVTNLSPNFRMPYATGALALTVLVNDIKGASYIFDKAVEKFPKDWKILYRASYQSLYEEKDYEKTARLMLAAAKNGGPTWLYSASARIYSEEGKMDVAEGILQDMIARKEDPQLIESMVAKVEGLRKKVASQKDEKNKEK